MNGLLGFTPEELTAILLSLRVAFWATLTSLPVGIVVALVLSRGRFWGKPLLDAIVHLPLVMPPVVTGYILLLLFGRNGPLGRLLAENLGIVFAFRWTGAALACAVMGFPLMVRSIRLSLDAVDRRLEAAAGTLGANALWIFATITLPLILPGVLAGMILSFARALGEFGATRLQHPRGDADDPDRDLLSAPGAGRDVRRPPPDARFDRDLARRADRRRAADRARRPPGDGAVSPPC